MATHLAQLVAKSEGPNILLDKPILLIGRSQECDIQIPSRKISRRHCCIAQVDDHLVVRDLGSTNGIRINGVRVNEGQLIAGDELTVGNFCYQVSFTAHPTGSPPFGINVSNRAREDKDSLDSCDVPVPLAESQASSFARANRPSAVAQEFIKSSAHHASALQFPDSIKLAPLSDSHLPPPK
jgi:pSer/pThr/pTyr-binding forkhead associated (FHA) protein